MHEIMNILPGVFSYFIASQYMGLHIAKWLLV